jgi:hypothetical protein
MWAGLLSISQCNNNFIHHTKLCIIFDDYVKSFNNSHILQVEATIQDELLSKESAFTTIIITTDIVLVRGCASDYIAPFKVL